MTISLLCFPFLVQKVIFEEIDLLAVLSITMLSKKSQATARACLRHHKYHLGYDEDYSIQLERKFEKEDGHILDLVLNDGARPLFPCQEWRIGSQEVLIKSTSYPTSMPFNFDSISMDTARWVSKEHFIKLFLSCKQVELDSKNFNNADLTAIFKSWTEGSRLEYLQFEGTFGFYHGKTLTEVVRELPGATAVRNAIVPAGSTFRTVTFGEDECFLIQQNDGQTRALVYIVYRTIVLSTNFQIGKDVDEHAARIEEGRHHLDENMEAEED
ncbi:unnamed protein product [Caenorhabditis brenneri]